MCRERMRNQFSPLMKSYEAGIGLFMCRNDRESSLRCGGPVKLVLACLCGWKDRERSFHHCGGLVKLA